MPKNERPIPPDLERCQAESRGPHSFMTLGPPPKMERCKNTPTWIGSDGIGSMSLCDECKAVCAKQMPKATFKKIARAYTVIGVYISGDVAYIGQRFADHVTAASPAEAEKKVRRKRTTDSFLIAAVIDGHITCAA